MGISTILMRQEWSIGRRVCDEDENNKGLLFVYFCYVSNEQTIYILYIYNKSLNILMLLMYNIKLYAM